MPTRLPLTAEQQQAAATTAAHAFIVAAPGAGKTTVAAERFGRVQDPV
jgi:DNA helicase II / ATP-dependent DNA helicase PcrA